eukprot:2456164-Rhodomonas_salina.2
MFDFGLVIGVEALVASKTSLGAGPEFYNNMEAPHNCVGGSEMSCPASKAGTVPPPMKCLHLHLRFGGRTQTDPGWKEHRSSERMT